MAALDAVCPMCDGSGWMDRGNGLEPCRLCAWVAEVEAEPPPEPAEEPTPLREQMPPEGIDLGEWRNLTEDDRRHIVAAHNLPRPEIPEPEWENRAPEDAEMIRLELVKDEPAGPGSKYDHELYDFLNMPEPDYQWVVEGLLEAEDRMILTGPEGGGKSTLLRQLTIQLAAGVHPFTLEPIPPARTMLIDLENSQRHVRRQLIPLVGAAGPEKGVCRIVSLPSGINLLDPGHLQWLHDRVAAHQTQVLIMGPIYKMANGDPTSEEVAKVVAYALDSVRTTHGCAIILEAHQPYAQGGTSRPERPYGASLWSRWPEFGLHLSVVGQLRHWRGDRDERAWPMFLQRGKNWPWEVAETPPAPEDGYDRPSHCREQILAWFADHPDQELSVRALAKAMKDDLGSSFRREVVSANAEGLAVDGALVARNGPRDSRLYSIVGPEPEEEAF